MRYLRSTFLVSLSLVVISPLVWASQSVPYTAGRMATFISDCGRHDLNNKLYKIYGYHKDYSEGELSVDVWSVSNTDVDCDAIERYVRKLLGRATTANSYSSPSRGTEAGDRTLCYMAYDAKLNTWDHSSNSARYVREAKSRGFSPSSCARVLGQATTVASNSSNYRSSNTHGRPFAADSNFSVCNIALKQMSSKWDTSSKTYRANVREAKSRGLKEQDCARILGRSVTVASNTYSSRISRSTEAGDRTVCYMAYDAKLNKWDHSSNSVRYVREAKSRGFSPRYCASILDGTSTVVSRPDPQPSSDLIKRTQEALRSLGLYRGKIDGVVGVQSRSGLKLWQKQKGFADTGKIEEAQIVKLESDALAIIAKREEERKEKAKRLAEANRIKNPDAIAVIIGNRDYKGSTPDVDFAGNDADAMKAYVLNTLGYRPGNIIDLRDASKAQLEDAFGTKENHKGRLYDYVRADESDVIVFYSGHGVPGMSDKRGYLLAVDANPNRAELTGYPVDILLKNLAKVPAKSMMVFIDACFSGDSPKGMLVRATSGLTVKITAPKKASDNMIVITAAEGDQFASWDEDAKHGLFTKHLLEALNGAADKHVKTGNKDGKVTLGEVKAYLDREMTYQARRRFSRDQNATVSGDLKTVLSAY